MRFVLAAVTQRRQGLRPGPARELFESYGERIAHFAEVETVFADSEAAVLQTVQRTAGRIPPHLVLLDSRGKPLASEAFAAKVRDLRDGGIQQVVFAIGPASGWSDGARANASWFLSLGPMTLPHELALVLLAEQLYRAQTIIAGHPYHCGH